MSNYKKKLISLLERMAQSSQPSLSFFAIHFVPLFIIKEKTREKYLRRLHLNYPNAASQFASQQKRSSIVKWLRAQMSLIDSSGRTQILMCLRRCANSTNVIQNQFALALYRVVRFDSTLQDKFYEAIIRNSNAEHLYTRMQVRPYKRSNLGLKPNGAFAGSCRGCPIPLSTIGNTQAAQAIETMVIDDPSCGEIHIVVGSDMALNFVDSLAERTESRIVLYTLNERLDDIAALNASHRIKCHVVRQEIDELGPLSKDLATQALQIGQQIMARLEQGTGLLELANGQVIHAQSMADDFFREMMKLECYRETVAGIGTDVPLIFACASNSIIYDGLKFILGDRGLTKTGFLIVNTSKAAELRLWSRLERTLTDPKSSPDASVDWQHISNTIRGSIESAKHLARAAAAQVKDPEIANDGAPPCVLLYNRVNEAYVETLSQLVRLTERGRSIVLVDTSSHVPPPPEILSYIESSSAISLTSTRFLSSIVSRRLNDSDYMLARILLDASSDYVRLRGTDISDVLIHRANSFLARKLPAAFAMAEFCRAIADSTNAKTLLTIPSRHWLVRAAAEDAVSGQWATVCDLQVLNAIKHPKYIVPICNIAAVVDESAADFYKEEFGVDSEKIRVIGSLREEAQLKMISNFDCNVLKKKWKIDATRERCVLLASQPEPIDKMLIIARALFVFAQNDANVTILIKMHPREGDDRVLAYLRLAREMSIADRIHINREITPAEAIALCDVCVTIYSNMAREAALSGKGVLLAHFDGFSPPIRLDIEGLGIGLKDENKLSAALSKYYSIGDWSDTTKFYLSHNKPLLDAKCHMRLEAMINEADNIQDSVSLSLMRKDIVHVASNVNTLIAIDNCYQGAGQTSEVLVQRINLASSGKENAIVRESLEAASELSSKLALTSLEVLSKTLAGTELGSDIGQYRDGLSLLVRADLVVELQRIMHLKQALDQHGGPYFIDASDSKLEIMLLDLLHERNGGKFGVRNSRVHKGRFIKEIYEVDQTDPVDSGSITTVDHTFALSDNSELEIERWRENLAHMLPKVKDTTIAVWAVATDHWTVLPTIEPVMREFAVEGNASEVYNVVFDHTDRGKFDFPIGVAGIYLSPRDYQKRNATPNLYKRAELSHLIAQNVLDDAKFDSLPRCIVGILAESVDKMLKSSLWTALAWAQECENFFGNANAVAISCPGRQWHAVIADTAAALNGTKSITLQNAYMFKGHTYTAPTGSIVTAIDTSQKQLFETKFKIPKEKIVVTGTPRFDYLGQLFVSGNAHTPSNDLIVIAAQIGYEELSVKAINWVDLLFASGEMTYARCIVCPHPNSDDDAVRKMSYATEAAVARNSFKIAERNSAASYLQNACLVITAFSNVGLEAAVLSKPVVTLAPETGRWPLPLHELGLAEKVDSSEAFLAFCKTLTDTKKSHKLTTSQNVFFAENPVFRQGSAKETIVKLIRSNLETGNYRQS